MRAVVQRVSRASVTSDAANGEVVGAIGPGLCVLLGVTHDDGPDQAQRMATKLWGLRILDDAAGVMNRSLGDVRDDGGNASVLLVSQFTLYGDTSKGRRPSWSAAARPDHAEPVFQRVADALVDAGATVATGRFRTQMAVELVNDGPVTVIVEV